MVSKKTRRNNYLLANGQRIDARLMGVYQNIRIAVNGEHPFRVRCKAMDHSGQMCRFESDNLWHDPSFHIEQQGIKSLPVYVHANQTRQILC